MSWTDAWKELGKPIRSDVVMSNAGLFQQRRRLLDQDDSGAVTINGETYSPHDVTGYTVSVNLYDLNGNPLLALTAGPVAGQEDEGYIKASATTAQTAVLYLPLDVGVRSTDAPIGILRWIVTDDLGESIECFRDNVWLAAE
jgi:hypothetical protein